MNKPISVLRFCTLLSGLIALQDRIRAAGHPRSCLFSSDPAVHVYVVVASDVQFYELLIRED